MPLALTALRLSSVAFIIPYAFVLGPALLLMGSTSQIVLAIASATIGIFCLALAIQYPRLLIIQRLLFFLGAMGMVFQGFLSDIIGGLALITGLVIQLIRHMKKK